MRQLPRATCSTAEREDLWYALSDLFVDSLVDWRWIMRACAGYDRNLLYRILFEEVAPYCGHNFCTPVPPVWNGFERESLIAGIHAMLQERQRSLLRRAVYALQVRTFRKMFHSIWVDFAVRLDRTAAARTPEELDSILAHPFFDAQ